MALLLLTALAGAAGIATILLAERTAAAASVGIIGSVVILGLALILPVEDSFTIGGVVLVGSPLLRSVAIAWALGTLLLGVLEVATAASRAVVGPSLVGLGVGILAIASRDPGTSFAALAAGGVAAVAGPSLLGWLAGPSTPTGLVTATRGSLAVLGAGLLGIVVVAWGASAVGPLGGDPLAEPDAEARLAIGLGLLAMVAAVALRSGLIPLHLWAARFTEGVSPLAVPAAFAWGTAAFVLVALEWSQVAIPNAHDAAVEHVLVIAIALASLTLGGIAAMVHDDVEHVLGYSILQDAGIAVLAFASLKPEIAEAARNWLVASAAVKTALAAWAAVVRATFGGHRLADLAGWARRSPLLGAAFAVIVLGAIGLPGTALFDARYALVSGAIGGLVGLVVVILALTPILYLGRVAATGISAMAPAVASSPAGRLRWRGGRAAGWSRSSPRAIAATLPRELRSNRIPLMAIAVLVLALVGLALSLAGPGS